MTRVSSVLYLTLHGRGQWIVRAMLRISALLGVMSVMAAAEPPYDGTIFIDPDIITAADPTAYLSFKAAETWLLWFAVRHRAERIDVKVADTVKAAIPHRMKYFDSRKFDLSPAE
jgi:hypothetical protein